MSFSINPCPASSPGGERADHASNICCCIQPFTVLAGRLYPATTGWPMQCSSYGRRDRRFDWDRLADTAKRYGLTAIIYAAMNKLMQTFDTPIPIPAFRRLSRRHAIDRAEHDGEHGPEQRACARPLCHGTARVPAQGHAIGEPARADDSLQHLALPVRPTAACIDVPNHGGQ